MAVHRSFRFIVLALLWALSGTTLGASPALAHAFLEHAEPRVGSSVVAPPESLTLSFTEPIEPSFSRIEVRDSAGRRVDTGPMRHAAPNTLAVALQPLPPGTYRVHWTVTSVDTHETEGTFQFSVSKP
jgi:methionine-rich copper-binding protein CopC